MCVRVMRKPWMNPTALRAFLLFSLLPPPCDEGWIQQVTFQLFCDLIHDVALQTDVLNCWTLQSSLLCSLASVFRVKFWLFHRENEVLPPRKEELQDCAYSSYITRSHTKRKKKGFLSTWMNIFFQTSVLSYIVCFYIKHEENPQYWHFRNVSVGKFNSDGNIFHLFQCTYMKISHDYLIGQLCSSSWVVWDCLIFISCILKASFTVSLLDFVLTNEVHSQAPLFCNI